jgi:predicted phage terminase large subunit-like protein
VESWPHEGEGLVNPRPQDYAFAHLLSYAGVQWPDYRVGAHHRMIADALERLERGEFDRLIITMPPRHGKSMLASEFFPAWYMGRNPDHYVVLATYSQDLADDFGRKVKNQIADPTFKWVFPQVALADDSRSNKRFHIRTETGEELDGGIEWQLKQPGAFYAVGVGGPLTGRGAHLLIIDDPVKNQAEADSELIRKNTMEWYTSTAYTRLMPGGKIIIIQTRWHEEDLTGQVIRDHRHEGWRRLNLPAINKRGEPLWPDQYDLPALLRIKSTLTPRQWSALYQQEPSPETGNYFKREWIRSYDVLPDRRTLRIYGGSDYAVTADDGDYTVHIVVGLDPEDRMYLLDLWRGQTASDGWVEAFCDLVLKWRPIGWAEETGQIKSGVGPFLTKRMIERKALTYREQFPTRGDKSIRAQSIRGRMAMQGLYVKQDAPYRSDLISEMMSFPVGVHDDQVDALGLVGQLLDKMMAGSAIKPNDALPKGKPGQVRLPPPPEPHSSSKIRI